MPAISRDRPPFPTLDRERFVLSRACGRIVFDVGECRKLHQEIERLASSCYGMDPADSLDQLAVLPVYDEVEVITCGGLLGKLADPVSFLSRLKRCYPGVPVILSTTGDGWAGVKALRTLLEPCGYDIREVYAERAGGLIVVAR